MHTYIYSLKGQPVLALTDQVYFYFFCISKIYSLLVRDQRAVLAVDHTCKSGSLYAAYIMVP